MSAFKEKITLAITGASGSLYALRLIECLVAADVQLYILCSSAARVVFDTEVGLKLPSSPEAASKVLTEKFNICSPFSNVEFGDHVNISTIVGKEPLALDILLVKSQR